MKSIRSFREKAMKSISGPAVLVLAMVVLLCLPQMVTATTHGSAGSIGWFSAMAMGNIAEQENIRKSQEIAREKESTVAAVVTDADDIGADETNSHGKETAEK